MEFIPLSEKEYSKLQALSKQARNKLILIPLLSTLPFLLIAYVPFRYLPRRISNLNMVVDGDKSIISTIGLGNLLLGLAIWGAIMGLATIATYKNLGLRKDLKDSTKMRLSSTVTVAKTYNQQRYARVKKVSGVSLLRFDHSNYKPVKRGDHIEFEVYRHSKILIRIIAWNPKGKMKQSAVVHSVEDSCPACLHKLTSQDDRCPNCGISFV